MIKSFQRVLVHCKSEERKAVLWVLSNVVLNSVPEMEKVIQSGIIANVGIACKDNIRQVRREAIYMLGNLLKKLCDEKMLQ